MTDYFGISDTQLETYKDRYALKPAKGYLKLAFLGLKYFGRELRKGKWFKKTDNKLFNIGILIEGGIGDMLYAALYISELDKVFDNSKIFVFSDRRNVAKLVFNCSKVIIEDKKNLAYTKLDLVISLSLNIPNLIYRSDKECNKKGKEYIDSLYLFSKKYKSLLNGKFQLNQLDFLLLRGKNCITGLDITNKLGIDDNSNFKISIPEDGEQIYDKYPILKSEKYITIARSVDVTNRNCESTRLWSVEKYEQFVKLFKRKFPGVKVVYLGPNKKSCKPIAGVDIDLVGKTTLSELMVVLKGAVLHFDSEGGMTHLRHFICAKKSIVLFGPTSPKLRSHPENMNIRIDSKCVLPFCEHVILNGEWGRACQLNGTNKCECLESINPEDIVNSIKEL
ncbi:MAG: hypothetical protein I3J00_10345 [Mesosutterella multiformis]|nr:hypothetical protein [Mesosutterella multiformis]